jgi:hypothetical protein
MPATYQWKRNGVTIIGATNAVFISSSFADGDFMSCVVTVVGPCGPVSAVATVHMTVTGGAGIGQVNTHDMDIRLLPNPNKGAFTIKGDLGITDDQDITLEVTNMLGQSVYKAKATVRRGRIDIPVQLDNTLANGMYILKVRTENGDKTINFVIGN